MDCKEKRTYTLVLTEQEMLDLRTLIKDVLYALTMNEPIQSSSDRELDIVFEISDMLKDF